MSSNGDYLVQKVIDAGMGVFDNVFMTPPPSGAFVFGIDSSGAPLCMQGATTTSSGLMSAADKTAMTALSSAGATKRKETYSGTTNASGTFTVTFVTAFAVAPNIQANIINGTDTQNLRITAVSTTGFTVLVRNRTDVVGLLPTWANVTGASVDVLINEK